MARTASERLRRSLVAELRAKDALSSDRVEAAFLSVPRELFLAHTLAERGLNAVYRDDAIVTKRDPRGLPLSSSSQPALMAKMLELLDPRPGDRVLEIGAGTGYNAALLAHLVGPTGRVTSIDIDPELARQARRSLRDAGMHVTIVVGDGRQGHPPKAPYDRIIATASGDEIPTAWLEQLREGGRLELPLRLDPERGAIQLIPVLERRGNRLRSVGLTWGGFVPLHDGDGARVGPPATLSAISSVKGRPSELASISGAGLQQLSRAAARSLLVEILAGSARPRKQGMTDLGGSSPPLQLLYLMLNIPASRRVSFSQDGRLGVGVIHPRRRSAAIVSLRSPWRGDAKEHQSRARWRLDAYGPDSAAVELEQLLARWRELEQTGATKLLITGEGTGSALRLRFAWVQSYG